MMRLLLLVYSCFFFQAEDGIRDLVRSRGLGDVYKRQTGDVRLGGVDVRKAGDDIRRYLGVVTHAPLLYDNLTAWENLAFYGAMYDVCLLYTSDAADERSSVDLGGRRIIKKKKTREDRDGLCTIKLKSKVNTTDTIEYV